MMEWIHKIIRLYCEPEPSEPLLGRVRERVAPIPRENKIRRRIRQYIRLLAREGG